VGDRGRGPGSAPAIAERAKPRRPTASQVRRLAKRRLGFAQLRPGQLEGVQSVVSGRDTLCIMSTGSGKSAIYQLAGLLLEGPTIVVSPLIALQRDQVEDLSAGATGEGAVLNSTLTDAEYEQTLEAAEGGTLRFLLLAPEQLAKEEVLADLRRARPSLFVVDEAHCVSEWGHDFRPDYLSLASAIEAVGRPAVLALTATAAPPVRADITDVLGMRDANVIVRGFDRPNIHLAVERFHDAERKRQSVLDAVAESAPPGIVYVATRRASDEVAEALCERGVAARAYHGGLSSRRRDDVQEAFMTGTGCDVVVATVAFGMGIDKPDVRWVYHEHVSDSVDSLYQELGRAGRDGEAARSILYYRPEDLGVRRFFAAGAIERDALEQVTEVLARTRRPVDPVDLADETKLSKTKLSTALHRLEEAGAVDVRDDGTALLVAGREELDGALDAAAEAEFQRESFDRSRIEMLRAYAEHDGCRRAFILGYFGEEYTPPCGNCDNCDAGRGAPTPTAGPAEFAVGDHVRHPEWGEGSVVSLDGDQLTVVFDSVGYRTLALEVVRERDLLTPVS
jgi:ATP-dependent DNA helicase RecQ